MLYKYKISVFPRINAGHLFLNSSAPLGVYLRQAFILNLMTMARCLYEARHLFGRGVYTKKYGMCN